MIADSAFRCNCGYDFRTYRRVAPVVLPTDGLPSVWWFFTQSWRTFGANWRTFLILAAVPTVILPTVSALIFGNYPSESPTTSPPWVAGGSFAIITVIVMAVNTVAFITAAHHTSEGQVLTVGESYALSPKHVGSFLWTGFLYVVIVLAGLVLFIIPGIVLAIRYFAAPYLVILEGTSGRAALSRSTALAQGRKYPIWWRELGCGILFTIVLCLAAFVLTIAVGAALGDPSAGFAEQKPLWAETIELYTNIVSQALFVIFNVILIKSIRALVPSR